MKIIVDARWIFKEISGIPLYTRELIRALSRLDKENEYILLFQNKFLMDRTIADAGLSTSSNITCEMFPHSVFSIASQLALPSYLKRMGADVYHSPNYMIPMLAFPPHRKGRTACVITIHDLIPLLFPDHAPKAKKARMMPLYRFIMKQVSNRADMILTVSKNSARDIRRLLVTDPKRSDRVAAVYNGVGKQFSEIEHNPAENPHKLLYVGRFDPYKNVTGLVRIYDKVRRACSQDVRLVIAGSQDNRYPEAMELARSLGVYDSIEWTGYVDTQKLMEVYSLASVLVYPSLYEGFGLPVIEAMSAGLPVVCSAAGSLPEVAGEAAAVHDPEDEEGFVDSICGILNSTSRARELSRLGREQALKFTWENAARETLAVYEKAAGVD